MLKQRPSVARLKFMAEEDAKLPVVFQWIPVKFQKMATFRPGVDHHMVCRGQQLFFS